MQPTTWLEIHKQIEEYVEQRLRSEQRLAEVREHYLNLLTKDASRNWKKWKDIAALSHSHMVPDFDESPSNVYAVNPEPPAELFVATDGSQIFPSRHEIAPAALINISRIRINYAQLEESPLIDNVARLLLPDEIQSNPDVSAQDWVSDQRTLSEISILADLAEQAARECPALPILALTDGSLIFWSIAGRHEQEYEKSAIRQYTFALSRFQENKVPVAGYISRSGSREVVQLLQLIQAQTAVDHDAPETPNLPLTDTQIFSSILQEGQRSILFHSRSKVLEQYQEHRISFFYLNVQDEIAKVEIPQWVAQKADWVEQVAAQCLFQSRIGGGYPIVLSEAHEAAVVRGTDRETFYALIEQQMLQRGIFPRLSNKQFRKKAAIL